MKKIVFFTQNLDYGGVQKSVTTLANFFKNKYKVYIVLGEDHKAINYKIEDIKLNTIKTLSVDITKEGLGEELFFYRVKKLNLLLTEIKPDILISFEDYNNLIALNTTYQCKKVVSCRVNIQDTYVNKKVHLLDEEFYFTGIKSTYKHADKIITVSQYIQSELENDFNLTQVTTIYNGIEIRENIEPINYDNFILNIGRLHPQKGQLDLIKAFDMIKDKISQNLIIVGDGVLKNELNEEIKKRNLSQRILLVGFDEPYKYINKCSLFVFPSYYEGFSNTLLEVMSCKKNIISYDYSGSKEVLENKHLVPLGDVVSLASKIECFLTNKKTNEKLSQELFTKAKKFSLTTTLDCYKKEVELLCVES